MPEGYYSSGPNPNLRRFVEEHATPYDPATDDYDVPPFDQPITTTKATAIYNMHTYWSKKPHDAIRQYIRHYTQPGDLVLDPFCGSGGTALAALMEGRAAIAIDLSPAATFITKNYCTPVDVDELQRAFEELQAQVKPEMDWLYETRCDRCDGRGDHGVHGLLATSSSARAAWRRWRCSIAWKWPGARTGGMAETEEDAGLPTLPRARA